MTEIHGNGEVGGGARNYYTEIEPGRAENGEKQTAHRKRPR